MVTWKKSFRDESREPEGCKTVECKVQLMWKSFCYSSTYSSKCLSSMNMEFTANCEN